MYCTIIHSQIIFLKRRQWDGRKLWYWVNYTTLEPWSMFFICRLTGSVSLDLQKHTLMRCFLEIWKSLSNPFLLSIFLQGQEYIPPGFGCQDIWGAGPCCCACQHPLWFPWDIQCHSIDMWGGNNTPELTWIERSRGRCYNNNNKWILAF